MSASAPTCTRRRVRRHRGGLGLLMLGSIAFASSLHCGPPPNREETKPPTPKVVSPGALSSTAQAPASDVQKSENQATKLDVANSDPGKAGAVPDWQIQAQKLREEISPWLNKQELGRDIQLSCAGMLDAGVKFYTATEPSKEMQRERERELAATRQSDLAHCVRETSVRAAACATHLLEKMDSEFPWVLDQCMRAFPLEEEFRQIERRQAKEAHLKSNGQTISLGKNSFQKGERAESLEMTFVGDVMFGRYRSQSFDPIAEDGVDPFVYIKELLKSDLVVGNLETPVVEYLPKKSPIGSRFRFGASKEMARLLASAGFDVVSLANNHYFDLRERGQVETPRILNELGVEVVGSSLAGESPIRVETVERAGWKVGMIAVTCVRNAPERQYGLQLPYVRARELAKQLAPVVLRAQREHDIVAVLVHWGIEYAEEPESYQREVAHDLIDMGVDLVVGHHPHVLQAIEYYNGGLIAYSLGNFLFEDITDIPRQTGVLRVSFREQGACLEHVTLHPTVLRRYPIEHPVPATGYMATRIRARVEEQGKAVGAQWERMPNRESIRMSGISACDEITSAKNDKGQKTEGLGKSSAKVSQSP